MKAGLRSLIETVLDEPWRLVALLVLGLVLFWILRGCLPGLQRDALPGEVWEQIQHLHVVCVSSRDTPIWPGEARQPECGRIEVDMTKDGLVPAAEQAAGVTRAICYRITVESPHWQTTGETRHEIRWTTRTYSKVTILQHGEWQLFPDEDREDEQRWLEYGCPGAYQVN